MNYITINNRKKRVDYILDFEEENEFDDNKPMLIQEAYINDKLYANRLIYDTTTPKSYDWEAAE
jgi:hypothetical protein